MSGPWKTRIYGASDDLIEVDGEISAEGGYGADDSEALLVCSDGTILTARYGKADLGIWALTVLRKGTLFLEVDACTEEDASIHSDIAFFAAGLKWVLSATGEWERLK